MQGFWLAQKHVGGRNREQVPSQVAQGVMACVGGVGQQRASELVST